MLPLDILKFLSLPIFCIPSNNVKYSIEYSINNVDRYNCGVIEFFCNQDKSYFHTDKIQYLYYLNLILAYRGPQKGPFPGPPASARLGP